MALTYDPNSGSYIDPATGNVYHDAAGTQLTTDPGLKAQAQRNLSVANQLYAHLARLNDQSNTNINQENQLAGSLDNTIRGTAPSVASTQLYAALDKISRGANAAASGGTGANAALQHYGAIQAAGNAGAEANAAAAVTRAQEVQGAQHLKAGVLGQVGQQVGQQYATNVSGANAAAATAAGAQGKQAEIDQQNRMAYLNFIGNLANGAGAAGITAFA